MNESAKLETSELRASFSNYGYDFDGEDKPLRPLAENINKRASAKAYEQGKRDERKAIGEFIDQNQLTLGKNHIPWWKVAEILKQGKEVR